MLECITKETDMKKILIVVDYQHDFVAKNGALPVPNADKLSQNIQAKIDDPTYDGTIYTFDTHTKEQYDGSDEQEYFPDIHCEFETPGWNLFEIKPKFKEWNDYIESLKEPFDFFQSANEYFFTKNVFNIWQGNSTYPEWFPTKFPSDEYEIDVVGVATNYCVFMNVMGMADKGYKVNIIQDCVEGITNFPNGDIDPSFDKNITVMKNRNVIFK